MRYAWDSFRWRFVAAFGVCWWLISGPLPCALGDTRREVCGRIWRITRNVIMLPHEKHLYRPIDEVISEMESKP